MLYMKNLLKKIKIVKKNNQRTHSEHRLCFCKAGHFTVFSKLNTNGTKRDQFSINTYYLQLWL